jgi:hypothetical protein
MKKEKLSGLGWQAHGEIQGFRVPAAVTRSIRDAPRTTLAHIKTKPSAEIKAPDPEPRAYSGLALAEG